MGLQDLMQKKPWKGWDKTQWIIFVLIGILLMVIAIPTEKKVSLPKENEIYAGEVSDSDEEDYAHKLEQKLSSTLEKVEGAGRVEVMITLENNGESIVEKDITQTTSQNKSESSVEEGYTQKQEEITQETVYGEETGGKMPFVGSEKTPKIAGVLVVAEGADATAVKQNISEAVMALFQIDVNRIKVVKMNIQEEK